MTHILFDSKDEYFKSPVGAIRSGTEVTLRLLVPEDQRPLSAKAVVRYDRHDSPAEYHRGNDFDGAAAADGYVAYSTSFQIFDTGLYWYSFEVLTYDGILRIHKDEATGEPVLTGGGTWQQTVYSRAYDDPDWLCGGIIYHVFVDRFNPSGRQRIEMENKVRRDDWGGVPEWRPQNCRILNNDFFGGDLAGIREKLPYMADLHVTCLYLSPIFEAYSNHKYDTGNYEKIDAMFGTEEDFRSLCEEAGKYGIRVICDGVFAHTGSDSKYFDKYGHYADKAAENGEETAPGAYGHPDSPYRDWYFFHEDETYDCWWDIDTLPRLNKRNQDYIEYITGENGIVRKWLRAGAAGWRLDVADELPNDFLDRLVRAAKAEKGDALIIGEVWEDASNKIAYDERKKQIARNAENQKDSKQNAGQFPYELKPLHEIAFNSKEEKHQRDHNRNTDDYRPPHLFDDRRSSIEIQFVHPAVLAVRAHGYVVASVKRLRCHKTPSLLNSTRNPLSCTSIQSASYRNQTLCPWAKPPSCCFRSSDPFRSATSPARILYISISRCVSVFRSSPLL